MLTECSPGDLLDLITRLGLAEYLRRIDADDPPFNRLRHDAEQAAAAAGLSPRDWPLQLADWFDAWAGATGPLARFTRRLALTPAGLFALGLAIACERRRLVALTIEALQAPLPAPRPTVHLALELAETLFAVPDDALVLADGVLIASGVIALAGAEALPHRTMALNLPLWRALDGGRCAWPGGRMIAADDGADAAVGRAAQAIADGRAGGLVLRGPPGSGRAEAAAALAAALGRMAIEVPLTVLRDDAAFATACRDALWLPVVRVDEAMPPPPIDALPYAVLAPRDGAVEGDRLLDITLAPPPPAQRSRLWREALGEGGVDHAGLAASVLYPSAIRTIAGAARRRAAQAERPVASADIAAARVAAAPDALRRLAQPVPLAAGAGALVQTDALAAELAALVTRCQRRETVWEALGPSLLAGRTRGVRALFAGDAGTGKTTAASHIAAALAAPLYRCDLGLVMNKYIGETEKNLGSLFDHAEAADVILLFDEADALFGRRSEGSETGERYANMLTNYLLTRIETHGGVIILTTNAKPRIDPAFWRRLDMVIDFPPPGYGERLALWRSHLGARAPEAAVMERLASYCDLAGGHVRNAVLAAAALAPVEGALGLEHIAAGLRREYAKLGRALPAQLAPTPRAVVA